VAQRFEDERCRFGYWAVVERQINCMFATVHSP
jgi:hypothetical protein